jgi:DNA-directed RNA polymerase subunit M/transcription elongation factor TFIIS
MVSIGEGAAAITAALGFAREFLSVNKAYDDAEFKLKIASMAEALATAKIALADTQQELLAKDAEISALKRSFEFKDELVEARGYKYRKSAEGKPMGYACCPRCERDGKYYFLTQRRAPGGGYECPSCKSEFIGDVTHYVYPNP